MSLLTKPTHPRGTSVNRPDNLPDGHSFFDVSLGKPIWRLRSSSTGWVDASGAEV